MGRFEHYWYCWQLRLREDLCGNGDCEVPEFTVGGYSCDGNYRSLKHAPNIREPFQGTSNIAMIQDSFYKTLNPEQHAKAHANEFDFDCPDSLDFDALVKTLRDLKQGYI
ncbi:uridine kinase [Aspergillus sclerotialis]|uniref:Uridine kinase n=1 Tax=Aspergillus sclerotialis TaxID=2070753 RepID=A0A3A2ZCB5_9EURO|nr:uridine kinase [Aspergillus sclerotialis]